MTVMITEILRVVQVLFTVITHQIAEVSEFPELSLCEDPS